MPRTPEEKRAYMLEYNNRPEVIARANERKATAEYKAKHAELERARRASVPKRDRTMRERERWQARKNDPAYMEKARAYQKEWMRKHRATWTPVRKAKAAADRREYMSNNPGKATMYARKQNYGITKEQWDAMFAAQGSSCAICKSTDPHGKKGWQTDHAHDTGTVRGILCADCNRVVHNRTSPALLRVAADYIETPR